MPSKRTITQARRARRKANAEPQVSSQAPAEQPEPDERVKVTGAPDDRPAWARPGWSPSGDEGTSALDLIARHRAQSAFDEILSRRRRTNMFGWSDGVPPGFDPITGRKL